MLKWISVTSMILFLSACAVETVTTKTKGGVSQTNVYFGETAKKIREAKKDQIRLRQLKAQVIKKAQEDADSLEKIKADTLKNAKLSNEPQNQKPLSEEKIKDSVIPQGKTENAKLKGDIASRTVEKVSTNTPKKNSNGHRGVIADEEMNFEENSPIFVPVN